MKNKVAVGSSCVFIILLFMECHSQSINNIQYKALENSIDSILNSGDIVGFSACIVKEKEVVWSMVRGMADVENKIPVNTNTVFILASLSKTVTGAALIKLYDKGLFALDDDINGYLPFKIRNPNFPNVPITFRMLLTHTSSLNDNRDYINELYGPGDQRTISLGDIIKNCFDTTGSHYVTQNFLKFKPGDKWRYCNSNYVLIAYLVEQISEKPFSEYTKENLFQPLDMNETSWLFSDFDTTHIAVNYDIDTNDVNKNIRVCHYSWAGYPDGCLITSTPQFASFIIMLMNQGKYKGKQILKPEIVKEILTPQNVKIPPYKIIPPMLDMGLAWMVTESGSQMYFMHGGEGSGITTLAFFDPISKKGVIMFLTGIYLKETGEYAAKPKRYSSILFNLFSNYLN